MYHQYDNICNCHNNCFYIDKVKNKMLSLHKMIEKFLLLTNFSLAIPLFDLDVIAKTY